MSIEKPTIEKPIPEKYEALAEKHGLNDFQKESYYKLVRSLLSICDNDGKSLFNVERIKELTAYREIYKKLMSFFDTIKVFNESAETSREADRKEGHDPKYHDVVTIDSMFHVVSARVNERMYCLDINANDDKGMLSLDISEDKATAMMVIPNVQRLFKRGLNKLEVYDAITDAEGHFDLEKMTFNRREEVAGVEINIMYVDIPGAEEYRLFVEKDSSETLQKTVILDVNMEFFMFYNKEMAEKMFHVVRGMILDGVDMDDLQESLRTAQTKGIIYVKE